MTDRYYALTVILQKEIRDDDAEPILNAIKMIKGVAKVEPLIADPSLMFAQEEARMALRSKIFELFKD